MWMRVLHYDPHLIQSGLRNGAQGRVPKGFACETCKPGGRSSRASFLGALRAERRPLRSGAIGRDAFLLFGGERQLAALQHLAIKRSSLRRTGARCPGVPPIRIALSGGERLLAAFRARLDTKMHLGLGAGGNPQGRLSKPLFGWLCGPCECVSWSAHISAGSLATLRLFIL